LRARFDETVGDGYSGALIAEPAYSAVYLHLGSSTGLRDNAIWSYVHTLRRRRAAGRMRAGSGGFSARGFGCCASRRSWCSPTYRQQLASFARR
jgi:hypothetical protein